MGEAQCVPIIVSLTVLAAFISFTFSILELKCSHNPIHQVKQLQKNLKRVHLQIDSLRKIHSRLILGLQQSPGLLNDTTLQVYSPGLYFEKLGPTEEYEGVRRRVYSNSKELWYYVSHQLRRALNGSLSLELRETIVRGVADRKRSLLSSQERLPSLDGYEKWRRQEAASLSDLIQRRLQYLQNPRHCPTAKKLLCSGNFCGIGCNYHHMAFCLVVAYSLERCLLFRMVPNRYFGNIFHPLSETCVYNESKKLKSFYLQVKNIHSKLVSVYLPNLSNVPDLPVRPYYIPVDLAQRMVRFNGDPYSWWIGQIVKYVLRLRRPDIIDATIKKINFTSPIVGVHIRRTDKLSYEAKYYSIDEYMSHVADYYAQLELTRAVDQRRVYLATDDVSVLEEAIVKYPQYTFYGDYYNAELASMDLRYTLPGLSGAVVDLYVLSMCDYVVCTFSSNIGRLAYELMQTRRLDAVNRFTSLDSMYYFTQKETRARTAVMRNKDMALEIGDLIVYKCLNTTSKGSVLSTTTRGRIPWYKTEETYMQYSYPEYRQVPENTNTSPPNLT